MLTQQEVIDFCNSYNYDIRKSGNGRWIDQKCTADVITIIADSIFNFVQHNKNEKFTTQDIWHSQYSIENVQEVFKKPGVVSEAARNEYDKFFQQPMELMANAQILIKEKQGRSNVYKVNNIEVIEYIALREKNALFFLKTYIEKVLSDSGIMYLFEDFFNNQTNDKYIDMKEGFSDFTIKYTKINGKVECNRIFIKVLNPLAYYRNTRGTERGRMSSQNITYDMLMYNRNNFRDIYSDKPKTMTRKEYAITHPVVVNEAYYNYQSAKAKRYLRYFNDQFRDGRSEHMDGIDINDLATNIHHIFPQAGYLEISHYIENLIALTPTQHFNYAHPKGRTQEIDEQYQHLLLLAKVERIKENFADSTVETIYDFSKLLYVLHIGFDNDNILEIEEMDFNSVIQAINMHYIKK